MGIVHGVGLAVQIAREESAVVGPRGRVLDREPEAIPEVLVDEPLGASPLREDDPAEGVVGPRNGVVLEVEGKDSEVLVELLGSRLVIPAPGAGKRIDVGAGLVVELAGHVLGEVEQVDLVVLVRDRNPHPPEGVEAGPGELGRGHDPAVEGPGLDELGFGPAHHHSEGREGREDHERRELDHLRSPPHEDHHLR